MTASKNLSVSRASMIMYALTEQFEKGITRLQMLTLDNKIILEKENFPISMPKHLVNKVEQYMADSKMNKNNFIGLIVSDYFESLPPAKEIEGEKHKLTLPLHKQIKDMLYQYAEEKYMNVGLLVAQSIENGKYEGVPELNESEKETVSYNIPKHIYEDALTRSAESGIPLHFYVESCLYNAFMSENKIFELENADTSR
ncbi:hypothetical protein [Streptomyces atratus]|uniref:hypothetical protein n=1 Tax=Streptomyces atratus TaxID=1893 RepID=UPI0036493A5B